MNYVGKYVAKYGRHGIQLMPEYTTLYALIYADDIALLSDTVIGLQNQLNNLEKSTSAVGLQVNIKKQRFLCFVMGDI